MHSAAGPCLWRRARREGFSWRVLAAVRGGAWGWWPGCTTLRVGILGGKQLFQQGPHDVGNVSCRCRFYPRLRVAGHSLSLCTPGMTLDTHQLCPYHISSFRVKRAQTALSPTLVVLNKGYNKTNVQTHWLSHWFPEEEVHT